MVWLGSFLLIVVSIIVLLMLWYQLQLRPVNAKSRQSVSYTLVAGTKVDRIAEQLYAKKLIRSQQAFVLFVSTTGRRSRLQAGSYELSPANSSQEIAEIIVGGKVAANRLVVPEGITLAKFKRVAEEYGVGQTDLVEALNTSYSNSFLASRPAGLTLEGYLFPDSYELTKPVQAKSLVQAMLDNFGRKLSASDIEKRYSQQGLTLHQGLTLASIVEKEVSNDTDRAMVAQVFLNRLKIGQALQSDVTVDYASSLAGVKFNLSIESPYNTYRTKGLPPSPICSPSLSSMQAVARPRPNDYLYFLADKQGKTHFAKTLTEHEQNVQKYLR